MRKFIHVDIPRSLYDRWIFQMNTPYENLPEEMKPSDRDEADKMMAITKECEEKKKETGQIPAETDDN
jgi:hypothetical protein